MSKVRLEYVGVAHIRQISKESFKLVGVENQDGIEIDRRIDASVEVSKEAADYLLKAEKGDWKAVDTAKAKTA